MRTLFTLLAFVGSLTAFAQGNSRITGTVSDSTSSKPVEFATIALNDPTTNKPVDGTIADDQGKFTLTKVADGNYIISITFIGFDTKSIPVRVGDKKEIDLGTIKISPVAQQLKEVTVEGERALIEERVDRTIYNAENDQTAKGGDATDVLKRVPLLTVDMDGNVSLRGNQNITVLINNKPSTIVASSVADALKQIPADQIKTVEVITSPSAKYDAEGSAGIINIVTKKNNLQGLTLGVDVGAGNRGSNLGLNGNYRKGKMGFSLGGWGRANYNVKGSFVNEQTTAQGVNLQTSDSRNRGLFGNYNLGWDYDINDKNILAASVRFGVRNHKNFQDNLLTQFNGNDGSFREDLRDAATDNVSNNVDVSLTYTHLYAKPSRELSFQGLYGRNNNTNNFINNAYDLASGTIDNRIKNLNDSYNQEATFQVDYQTPISTNQMFEIGAKNILRKAVSDFSYLEADGPDGEFVVNPSRSLSNNLNYDQNVTAGYLAYTYSAKSGYSLKAGSRYEYTTIKAYTQTEDNIYIKPYDVIVPSVNLSKKLKSGTLKASYNRRIQRPSIRFLNPNRQSSNPLNITEGNPSLHPEYTNNYELGYSTFFKGTTINLTGFYRNTNDAIQSFRDVLGGDTIRTTYKNIGHENAYGASLFASVNLGKLTLNGGGDVFYASLDNMNPDMDLRASNEGWVVNGRLFGSYNLDKGWGLQFFSFGRGRQVQLQGTQGSFYMYSLAIRKEFNEKRGSVGVGFENFAQKNIKIKTNLESPALTQRSTNIMYNSGVRVNFSYRIGKMSMENRPRRRTRGINNDDLKEGDGGDGGMGQQGGGGQQGGAPVQMQGGGQRPTGQPQQQQAAPQQNPLAKPAEGVVFESAGTWNFTIDSPQGGTGVIVIKKENDVYSGTIKTERMPNETPFTSVVVKGNDIVLTYSVTFGGNTVPVTIKSMINDKAMQGTMAMGEFRTFNLNAKKAE